MAITANFKATGYGTYTRTLGNAANEGAIIIEIETKRGAEFIEQIDVSYSLLNLAALNSTGCLGGIQVFRSQLSKPNLFPDPMLPVNDQNSLEFDQRIRTQGLVSVLGGGKRIVVPEGQTYSIVLSAAYAQGDVATLPSNFFACLTVRGRTQGKDNVRIEEVTGALT